MKRITVGRGNDCDIVIVDETDNISRHHLVISFNFFGKMKVSDTSSNGTSINGTRMLKGTSIPVTKADTIRLSRNIDLDWNLVKDPYRPIRTAVICILTVLIVSILCIVVISWYKEKHSPTNINKIEIINTETEENDNWNKDSTAKVAPTITSIDIKDKKNSTKTEINKKETDINQKKKEVKKADKQIGKTLSTSEKKNSSELDSIAVL